MPLIEATCPLKWESSYGGVYDDVSLDSVTGRPFVCFRLTQHWHRPEMPDNAAGNPGVVSREEFRGRFVTGSFAPKSGTVRLKLTT